MNIAYDEVIGFAGLGLMGLPMARRISQAGRPMAVWTRSGGKAECFAGEHRDVQIAITPAELARRSRILVLMLADSAAVEQVVAGANGVLEGMRPGSLLIDMGTTSVALTRGGRCRTQRKDLQQALELAAELGVEMPATRLCRDLYDGLVERGDGDLDHSALVREIRARSGAG